MSQADARINFQRNPKFRIYFVQKLKYRRKNMLSRNTIPCLLPILAFTGPLVYVTSHISYCCDVVSVFDVRVDAFGKLPTTKLRTKLKKQIESEAKDRDRTVFRCIVLYNTTNSTEHFCDSTFYLVLMVLFTTQSNTNANAIDLRHFT